MPFVAYVLSDLEDIVRESGESAITELTFDTEPELKAFMRGVEIGNDGCVVYDDRQEALDYIGECGGEIDEDEEGGE
jgi:hypothetical protein